MKTVFGIVVLVGLAITSQASCFKSKKEDWPVPEVDLYGLSEYLVGEVPSNATEANLAQLTKDYNSLSGPMKKAADLALDLSKVVPGECSEQLRALIVRAGEAGLKVGAPRRIDQVVNGWLTSALDSCNEYLRRTLKERVSANNELRDLIERLNCQGACNERTLAYWVEVWSKGDTEIRNICKVVTGDDKKKRKVVDVAKFEAAFEKYLAQPCDKFNANLGDLAPAIHSFGEVYTWSPKYNKIYDGFTFSTSTIKSKRFCDRVKNMDEQLKTYMGKKFCH